MHGYGPPQGHSDRQALILEHLPQVRLVARQIHERLPEHVSLDDLISTGTIGLIAAIDRYDPAYNVQLNTYAEHKIRGAILDSLRSMDFAPRERRKKARQVEQAIHRLEQTLGRAPKEEEMIAELRLTPDEYQRWLTEMRGLDVWNLQYVSGDEAVDMLQFIADEEENLPSRQFERSELERLVAEGITKMPKQERTVLSLYYQEELNIRQISEVMGVHVSRVSQLKSQAVLRLRTYLNRKLFVQRKATSSRTPGALPPN
jgi:RNA polymerase sigma factor FliA